MRSYVLCVTNGLHFPNLVFNAPNFQVSMTKEAAVQVVRKVKAMLEEAVDKMKVVQNKYFEKATTLYPGEIRSHDP
jgi:hypothetical protein